MVNAKIHGPDSIGFMYASGRIAAKVLDEVEESLRKNPYQRTIDIDKLCTDLIIANGATAECIGYNAFGAPPYQHATCISRNDVACHGIPSEEVLEEGDIVNVDLVVNYQGWLADTSRTFLIGKTSLSRSDLVYQARQAMYAGMKTVKPGAEFRNIGKAIEEYCKKIRIGGEIVRPLREYCGHGISKNMHEKPLVEHVKNSCNIRITPYTYFTIEPILVIGGNTGTHTLDDHWTIKTNSGKDAAQFEHTMGLDNSGILRIFTTRDDEHEREILNEISKI